MLVKGQWDVDVFLRWAHLGRVRGMVLVLTLLLILVQQLSTLYELMVMLKCRF